MRRPPNVHEGESLRMATVRPAAVSGLFYPGEDKKLRQMVRELLHTVAQPGPLRPKALIVPHAGYVYSGPVAASAYALLRPLHAVIRRVVLLGPVHRVWVEGLALPVADQFETPLGSVPLDESAIAALRDLPQVETNAAAHAMEHSLEVHLPFLQEMLDAFTLVPLVVGGAGPHAVAEVIERLWGGEETLVVASSDLSHYLPYGEARRRDANTVTRILALESDLDGEEACGAHAVNGLTLVARRKGLRAHLIDLRNSGDTAGDKARVVGYAAIAFTEATHVRH